MNTFHSKIATLSHQLVQLERDKFFGSDDHYKWMPLFQKDNASVMCPPYVGKSYKKGGLLLMPINPGGGTATSEDKNDGDDLVYPLIHEFKSIKKDVCNYYWEKFIPIYKEAKPKWRIYKQMKPILEASECDLDNICNFNFLPYKVRDDEYPTTLADMDLIMPKCRDLFLKSLIALLSPSIIVNFGKQVDKYRSNYWQDLSIESITWNRARAPTPEVKKERKRALKQLRIWAKNQRCS
tara:strand:+ start:109 stop:822 length:714 start_codon:yes stop_codon:yes gene_type:complete